jgi:tRNA pseudouridine synthase 10
MKIKYGSQPWFQQTCISAKDALKFSLLPPLQNLLVSSFLSLSLKSYYSITKYKLLLYLKSTFHSISFQITPFQECKSSVGSLRIRLTYTESKEADKCSDNADSCKRRKTGMSNFITLLFCFL